MKVSNTTEDHGKLRIGSVDLKSSIHLDCFLHPPFALFKPPISEPQNSNGDMDTPDTFKPFPSFTFVHLNPPHLDTKRALFPSMLPSLASPHKTKTIVFSVDLTLHSRIYTHT
ncbi:hypothetical protein EYC80_006658 [Monilinia laxa]|uniref:Uncharacterized protein n=1 Tax=Monilinia laxa TaxID=61186 RepID=A0A5N6JSM2_MONLA|nr:hypothetical protein EYC80_006658 [Monilinia laxa]